MNMGEMCSVSSLCVLLLFALPACTGEGGTGEQQFDIHTVKRSDLRITVREQGEIQAARNTRVASQLEGSSTVIYLIPEGSVVEEGEKLAELDVSGITDKRATQAISVAKAAAALEQARKRFEIMERQLAAAEKAAHSRLTIAKMRQEKFTGKPAKARAATNGGFIAGTNREMETKLRKLLDSEFLVNAAAEVNYSDLTNEVIELMGEEHLDLQMGDMANQILRQTDQISLARSDLELAKDTLSHSQNLFENDFITKNELQRDTIAYDRDLSKVTLAWNDLELLISYTLRESKISLAQDVENAELDLDSVKADNEATRVREEAELVSNDAEFELATERLDNWNRQIANAVIRAPTPGLVVYATEGGGMGRSREPVEEGMAVRERQALINLPDVTTMIAELKVHEAQISKVALTQPATIEIDAFPERLFTGHVSNVAALPDSGSMFTNQDLKVYKTRVTLDGHNEDRILRPGMTATVEIHIGVLKDVVNVPLPALKRQAEVQYVWKVTPEGPVATRVQLGLNNTTHVEIREGLEEGDRIYLAQPVGTELPEFDQPERERSLIPEIPILTTAAAVDAGMRSRGSGSPRPTGGMGGGNMSGMSGRGMGGGSMQSLQQLREFLIEEIPEYSEQLADERGWFSLLRDPDFQRAADGALKLDPDLRAQWQGLQEMMSGMGRGERGGGRESGRRGSGRGGEGSGPRGGQS
jgi:HlyD family secretion protein